MCPTEAQRLRLVCSATRRTPSRYFSKSRLDRPWPWVTMQKRCAPAASAARACSRICSGSIIACIGVSASAKRDCAQKPQSSAQPPDLALTSEHMSVESAKRSTRASQARSTSASICGVVLDLAQLQGFLAGDQRRHCASDRLGRLSQTDGYGAPRTLLARASAAGRFSANARMPSRMSCEANDARRSSISSSSTSARQLALGARAARRSRACCRAARAARCRRARPPARARAPPAPRRRRRG